MKQAITFCILCLLLAAALLGGFCLGRLAARHGPVGGAATDAQGYPTLSLPGAILPDAGSVATVPVQLAAAGAPLASVLFSLDIDGACLVFDPADANRDGIPDAVSLSVPPAFLASVGYDAQDTDGELDFVVADYSPPYATLPDGVLATVRLGVTCRPPGAEPITLPLPFSTAPAASFAAPSGSALYGTTVSGSILLDGSHVATPAPTATATPAPTRQPNPTGEPPPAITVVPTAPPTATPLQTGPPLPPQLPPNTRDDDGDGLYSREEGDFDWDGDGVPNFEDRDDDGDGIPTVLEGRGDADANGLPNYLDLDANDNNVPDAIEAGPDPLHPEDADGNGVWDYLEMTEGMLYLPYIVSG